MAVKSEENEGQITVEARLKRSEQINQRDLDVLTNRLIRGIMRRL